MPTTKAQADATARYRKKSVNRVTISFFPKDLEVYEHLKSKPRISEYIINLIRTDMNRSK